MELPPGARLMALGEPSALAAADPTAGVGGSTDPLLEIETTVSMPWALKLAIMAAVSSFFMPRSFCATVVEDYCLKGVGK